MSEVDRVRFSAALAIHPDNTDNGTEGERLIAAVSHATKDEMIAAKEAALRLIEIEDRLKLHGDQHGRAALELLAIPPMSGLALYIHHRLSHNLSLPKVFDAIQKNYRRTQSVIASGPRKRTENIARNDLIDAMKRARREGTTYKEFLRNLEGGYVEGLTAEMDKGESYTIWTDNSADPYLAKGSTLEHKLWTEANSPLTG
ncbi:MAG: hypothetical protein PF483_01650 [Halothiobacillus sp.]|jgi:hypothetical protein|nr:hypothetical protein [Halothiobacillus sp.]